MPTLPAKRAGPCAACGARIEVGELIEYQLHHGARHLSCVDRAPELRRNRFRTVCQWCGVPLLPGKGLLEVVETGAGGTWSRDWRASCEDVTACNERLGG